MKQYVLIFFSLLAISVQAQKEQVVEGGLPAPINKTDIYRLTVSFHLPEDEYMPIAFSYERKLARSFTLYTKAGPSISPYNRFKNNPDFSYSLNMYASAEFRWYINQGRRERKEKNARNFSSNYLSIEQYVISNPLVVAGRPWRDGEPGSTGTFLNLGIQRQYDSFYLNIAWGPRLAGTLFGNWPTSLSAHRGSITLGLVLFDK